MTFFTTCKAPYELLNCHVAFAYCSVFTCFSQWKIIIFFLVFIFVNPQPRMYFFIGFLFERVAGRGGGEERERDIYPFPPTLSWLGQGIEPATPVCAFGNKTLGCMDWCFNHWATLARVIFPLLKKFSSDSCICWD